MPFRLLVLALLASLLALPAVAQVERPSELKYPALPDFKVPTPARFVLPNGMVVMVMEDHELPLVNVIARIRTGSLLEPAEKAGLYGIAGDMLRSGGTTSMKPDALDEFLEGKAASIETDVGGDSGSASMSALKADAPAVLKVFADVLRRPAFDPDRLKIATNEANASISRQNDNPGSIRAREYAEVIYGEQSPFARTATYASIASITRDDLVAWHKKYLHPNRIILGIVGDVTTAEARKLVTDAFGDWPKGPAPTEELPVPRAEPVPGVFEALKADSTQSFVSAGHQGSLLRTHPDFYAVELLNEVLGGGFTSRLFSKVRTEKGLAYSVGGAIGSGWTRVSPFTISMSTKVETTIAGIEAMIQEARDLASSRPPTDAEVALAKSSILNSFVFNSDSRAEVLGQQMTFEYYGQPLDWLARYRSAIEKVTTAEVAAVAKKYIHPANFSIVVVGPAEGRDKPLSALGPVKPLDISIPEPTVAAPAPTAATPESMAAGRALVEKVIAAYGGKERLNALTSYDADSVMVVKGPQGEAELKGRLTIVFPDRVRQQLETPVGTMAFVLTPTDAFMQTPEGVQPMPPPLKERFTGSLRRSPLVILRHAGAPGFTASAVGQGKAGDTAVELVRVEHDGQTVTLGYDQKSGRMVSMAYRAPGPTGVPGENVEVYSDFRDVAGMMLPFKMSHTFNGEPAGESTVSAIRLNQPVDPKQFEKPQK
jgi:zinc protease